jgi:hypothetical protein
LEFYTNSYPVYKLADLQTKNEKGGLQRSLGFCTKALRTGKEIADVPLPASTATGRSVRHVLTGGEVSGGEGQA